MPLQIWHDGRGVLRDDVGVIKCDVCPCVPVEGCVLFHDATGVADVTIDGRTVVAAGAAFLECSPALDLQDDFDPRPVFDVVAGDMVYRTDISPANWYEGDGTAKFNLGHSNGTFIMSSFIGDSIGDSVSIFAPGNIEARWTITSRVAGVLSIVTLTIHVDGSLVYTSDVDSGVGADQGVFIGQLVLTDTELRVTKDQNTGVAHCMTRPSGSDTVWGIGASANNSSGSLRHGPSRINFYCDEVDASCLWEECDE
jgi:hypothetical protein